MARPTKKQRQIKQARELLANDTLSEIFAERERDIFERWIASETTEQREKCYYDARAIIELRDSIDTAASERD